MPELTAASVLGNAPQRRVAASIAVLQRKETPTEFGGYINFDQSNRFTRYQQLAKATPHTSTSLAKLGLSLVKGMQFDGRSARAVKEFETWAAKTNFVNQVQTLARLFCRDGTYIALPKGKDVDSFKLEPILLPATTILPEGFDKNSTEDLLQPEIETIMINEGGKKETPLEPDQVIIGTYNEWDSVQEDVKKRKTYGLYGESLMEPIELSIQNLITVNYGYVQFVKKYGAGRYHLDFEALGKLVENDLLDPEDAQVLIDKFLDSHQNLEENEDMATFGVRVNPLDAKGSLDVLAYKESLEVDVSLGLFQSPITMGKAAGSTYASGFLVEEDRMMVLEGLQKIIKNIANQAVRKRLEMRRIDPDSVEVEFEELSRIKLSAQEVLEWYNSGIISKAAAIKWGGFKMEDIPEEGLQEL